MPTILIIEDEVSLSKALKYQLEKRGFRVIQAQDGKQGINLLSDNVVDLVLLDILMPVMDGISFLKMLKADPVHKDIPVIVLSNLSSGEQVLAAQEQGIHDFLVKSDWNANDIVDRVEQVVSLDSAQADEEAASTT